VYMTNSAILDGFTLTGGDGGARGGSLYNCILTGNSTTGGYGGGASGCTLSNCTLTHNSTTAYGSGGGGGAVDCILYNCTLMGNRSSGSYNYTYRGGGALDCILYNCTLTGNSVGEHGYGGGAYNCTLFNCTLTGNDGGYSGYGGGTYDCTLNNCIVYYNSAHYDPNTSFSTCNYCCTTPNPGGTGNIDSEPMFVDLAAGNLRLLSNSPCINAGTNQDWMIEAIDLDGNPRICIYGGDRVDMGAYEYEWPGAPIHYVSLSGAHIAPFTNWVNAATNIQAAIDVAEAGDLVLVGKGVYETGGRITPGGSLFNRVVITNSITVKSVGGSAVTIIRGARPTGDAPPVRCVYISGGGVLEGFTLTNGFTRGSNSWSGDPYPDITGGGAYAINGTLNNCTLSGNSGSAGAGAYYGTLNNCTLSGNFANDGGGAYGGTLNNCIVYYNNAPNNPNISGSTCSYCCTTPDPGGTGNITNEPMFVDRAAGNLRLLSNSPCINAGTNQDWMIGATDLDGNPRIYGGGRVDMGAYEYQGSLSTIPTNWLAQYGLPIDGSADHGDADEDGMNNWQEWRCNTDPTNGTSFLGLIQPFTTSPPGGTGLVLRWVSTEGVQYQLNRSTNLNTDAFSYLVRTNIPATPPINSETDTTAVGSGPWFYRVGVE
jgi:hypothetical protein